MCPWFEPEPNYTRVAVVKATPPAHGPRFRGTRLEAQQGVAPRRPEALAAGLKGQTYRRRYAHTTSPVVYRRVMA